MSKEKVPTRTLEEFRARRARLGWAAVPTDDWKTELRIHLDADRAYQVRVYFIECGENGPIKIGHAVHPMARLENLQIGCPYELRLIRTLAGGRYREFRIHTKFKAIRIRGEWFQRTPELLQWIEQAEEDPAADPAENLYTKVKELLTNRQARPTFTPTVNTTSHSALSSPSAAIPDTGKIVAKPSSEIVTEAQ